MLVAAVSTLLIAVVIVPLLTRRRGRARRAVSLGLLACAGAIGLARHLDVDITGPVLLVLLLAASMTLMAVGRLGGRQ